MLGAGTHPARKDHKPGTLTNTTTVLREEEQRSLTQPSASGRLSINSSNCFPVLGPFFLSATTVLRVPVLWLRHFVRARAFSSLMLFSHVVYACLI